MDARPGHEGERHIISFGTSKLNTSQQLWSPCEVESLSLLQGMEENNFYLMGCDNFMVESDCSALSGLTKKPLAHVTNFKDPSHPIKDKSLQVKYSPCAWLQELPGRFIVKTTKSCSSVN